MQQTKPLNSVVTRLVAVLLLAGLLVSLCFVAVEYSRRGEMLRQETTREVQVLSRDVDSIVKSLIEHGAETEIPEAIKILIADTSVSGVELMRVKDGKNMARVGERGYVDTSDLIEIESLSQAFKSDAIDLQSTTRVRQFINAGQDRYRLEMTVDCREARAALGFVVIRRLGAVWVFMGVVVLGGLVLLRMWLSTPLTRLVEMTADRVGPEGFQRLADRHTDEFGELSHSIAGMLQHLHDTRGELERSECAFKDLYQSAPAAMLSLEPDGTVVGLNRRMAGMLGGVEQTSVIGYAAEALIDPADRPCLQQALRQLLSNEVTRCELRLAVSEGADACDVAVEAVAVRDESGSLASIRMSLSDITETARLHRDLARQTQTLHLVIDHMTEAILLVDAAGKVAAFNQKLSGMLQCHGSNLQNMDYDAQTFWQPLGLFDPQTFLSRLEQIEADTRRSAQETFQTRNGEFVFVGVPVNDPHGQYVGRLWVVKEADEHLSNDQLLQQDQELRVMREFTHSLQGLQNVDELMYTAAEKMFELLEVDAVGLAIRPMRIDRNRRSMQVIHRGSKPYLWQSNYSLVEAIESDLMPSVMAQGDVTLWTEMPMNRPWSIAAEHAGLTCLAASPLVGPRDAQGIVWIARRGGERLERHHLFLLETVAPFIAAQLEIAQIYEGLRENGLLDPITGLANATHLKHRLDATSRRPDEPWSLLYLRVDRLGGDAPQPGAGLSDSDARRVAEMLQATSRRSVFAAHLNQGNFVLLASGLEPDDADAFAQRVLATFLRTVQSEEPTTATPIGVSIGLAHSHEADAPDEALRIARDRGELAVRLGRNRIACGESNHARRAAP